MEISVAVHNGMKKTKVIVPNTEAAKRVLFDMEDDEDFDFSDELNIVDYEAIAVFDMQSNRLVGFQIIYEFHGIDVFTIGMGIQKSCTIFCRTDKVVEFPVFEGFQQSTDNEFDNMFRTFAHHTILT